VPSRQGLSGIARERVTAWWKRRSERRQASSFTPGGGIGESGSQGCDGWRSTSGSVFPTCGGPASWPMKGMKGVGHGGVQGGEDRCARGDHGHRGELTSQCLHHGDEHAETVWTLAASPVEGRIAGGPSLHVHPAGQRPILQRGKGD